MFIPRKIIKDTNPQLREKSVPVTFPLSQEDKELGQYLIEHIRISQDPELNKEYNLRCGTGLAACQVGVLKQMFAIYIPSSEPEKTIEYVFINPKVTRTSFKKAYLECGEGCLSVDKDQKGYVLRANLICIEAYDLLSDKVVNVTFKGYNAIVAQHELDHFNGVLYYDKINKLNPFGGVNDAVAV